MISPHWTLLYWYLCGGLVHHLFSFWLCLVGLPTWLDTRYSDFLGLDEIEQKIPTDICMHCVVVKSKICTYLLILNEFKRRVLKLERTSFSRKCLVCYHILVYLFIVAQFTSSRFKGSLRTKVIVLNTISTLYFIPRLFPKQRKKKSFSPFSAKIRPLGLIGTHFCRYV